MPEQQRMLQIHQRKKGLPLADSPCGYLRPRHPVFDFEKESDSQSHRTRLTTLRSIESEERAHEGNLSRTQLRDFSLLESLVALCLMPSAISSTSAISIIVLVLGYNCPTVLLVFFVFPLLCAVLIYLYILACLFIADWLEGRKECIENSLAAELPVRSYSLSFRPHLPSRTPAAWRL